MAVNFNRNGLKKRLFVQWSKIYSQDFKERERERMVDMSFYVSMSTSENGQNNNKAMNNGAYA